MDPDLQNYRAADQMSGNVVVANCKNYFYQGRVEYKESMLDYQYEVADLEKGADGQYYSPEKTKDISLLKIRQRILFTHTLPLKHKIQKRVVAAHVNIGGRCNGKHG